MSFIKFASKSTATWTVMILAGCSVGPNYKSPEIAVPASWNEAQQSGFHTGPGPTLTDWWTEFNDPLLDTLVERAVKSNLDIRLAEARIRESRALRAATAADAWPGLEAAGTYRRSRSSENAFVSGGGGDAFLGGNGAGAHSTKLCSISSTPKLPSAVPKNTGVCLPAR